jgi:dTDP-4-amino-4,6-dideoxygalactose transaminase
MKVPFVDLGAQWLDIESTATEAIQKVLRSGKSIGDSAIEELEANLSAYLNVPHVITLNSGTDALLFGLMSIGVGRGDEVITVANSFVASTAAIVHVGATPVFCDVGSDHLMDTSKVEDLINPKTKAIMPVHLEGKMCDMVFLKKLADKYKLLLVEDAAQAFGSHRDGFQPGNLSDLACFSFHPLKNLNGIGDGGFVATSRESTAERISILRNHGLLDRDTVSEFGFVSRLDSIQAVVLNIRLAQLDQIIESRREIASFYDTHLTNPRVSLPQITTGMFHSYHLYVVEVENRETLKLKLESNGIQTKIHYPKLICDQPAYKAKYPLISNRLEKSRLQASRILSLPIHQNLDEEQISFVNNQLNELA